jgi:hypothetical protein
VIDLILAVIDSLLTMINSSQSQPISSGTMWGGVGRYGAAEGGAGGWVCAWGDVAVRQWGVVGR